MLKFYQKEREIFREEANVVLSDELAKKITKKIARHFKIDVKEISFKKGRYSYAHFKRRAIKFRHNPSILTICHELAHLYVYQKYIEPSLPLNHRIRLHDKRLMKAIEKLVKYARKKKYWKE